MRVLVTSHLYPSSASLTTGSFVRNQVRFLKAHCDVRVIAPTPWFPPLPGLGRWSALARVERHSLEDGIEVARPGCFSPPRRWLFTRRWRAYLAAMERGLRASATSPPEILHAHCAYPDGRAAVELGKRLGVPVVITVHGADVNELVQADGRWRRLVVEALEGAVGVIANGQDLRRRVVDLGTPDEKVEIIPNGVDCSLFRPGDRTAGSGGWRLIYVGRFTDRKGVRVLLEAMAILCHQRADVRLALVGGGATGAAAPYRRLALELGIADRVELHDEVAWQDVPDHLAAADLLVLPSYYESFGLVLVEAMACGIPVVATRCGGPEQIVDAASGLLVEVGDPNGLARAVETVLADYGRYDRDQVRGRVLQRYDYPRLAARIHQVYAQSLQAG